MGRQCVRSGSLVSSPVRKKPRPPFNLGLEICNISLMIPHSAHINTDGVFLALIFVVVVTQSCFSAHCIIFHVQVTGVNGRLMSNLFLLAHNHLSRFSPCFFFFPTVIWILMSLISNTESIKFISFFGYKNKLFISKLGDLGVFFLANLQHYKYMVFILLLFFPFQE